MVLVRYRSNSVFSLGEWTPHLPAGLACPAVLVYPFDRSPTGLSPLSSSFPPGSAQSLLGGLLRVRSPLLAESFLFLALLRCFTSRGSLPTDYVFIGG